ncbi:transcriptional regulator with XRE-family HTH domain [Streptomyces aurantiacus]|uniref:helix-turn-helix domain-containing protein n=1 Tax=Streptomyces aurantiacus TaxID=47760 RepID=UPI0027939E50|nr:helix-turn-helix transcriptional regulator [Streptomyces aurantiacus]MDQ0777611.1 transcriptional regulator with XRE-family HTH domain [Streptomyces aurantiacus]
MAGAESEETGGGTGGLEEEQDWDEGMSEILEMVGRHVRRWRERAGLTQAELGRLIGYTEHQVSAVERGRRIPKPVFLEKADEVLGAGGMLAEFKEDVEKLRYPKKVRHLARLEADAKELGAYAAHQVHGLLQTKGYAEALYGMHRPMLDEDTIELNVAARLARQEIFQRRPAPFLSFVQDEVTLRRPVGGRMVMRGQLERLLEVGRLRNVEIQVMPTDREDHAGLSGGSFRLLDPKNGHKVAQAEGALFSRVTAERRDVHILEARYGIIRAQALSPRESLAFIEKLLGET